MQYVRSISGSVSKTWNSINPATLSGAIDVIVIEQADGTLACSPFHVRFGKFSLLRPYEKKVEFSVNGVKQDYAMKLGEGGEAFFVFETTADIPEDLQTSPVISPAASPQQSPDEINTTFTLQEPEYLDLTSKSLTPPKAQRAITEPLLEGEVAATKNVLDPSPKLDRPRSEDGLEAPRANVSSVHSSPQTMRSQSPPPISRQEAYSRAISLSKKLSGSNIPSKVTESGDLMLDMTGYKSSDDDALRAEVVARKILAEELEGNYDIGALIGADEHGNLWIYSSEEAKEAAGRKAAYSSLQHHNGMADDAVFDPGYQSDNDQMDYEDRPQKHVRSQSDAQLEYPTPPQTPTDDRPDRGRSYAKTLRLTSDQLKALNLQPDANPISFSVNKAVCPATMYLWSYKVPIVISDIDGTITKSDALGHVLNMIGRDWTHLGVAKLYTDIASNGYNIMYLTSRSTGQADTTRAYLKGILQDGYKLPQGPVIMSPDRTIAALRRELYIRKPEVFKMACLRDILSLFEGRQNPFYAGFGNRLTDALSYRTVNIPSTRIFTINSNAEVSLDLLSLTKYKSSYVTMRELVDHFFPPVSTLVQDGGEDFTDFTYWRDQPRELDEFSLTESDIGSDRADDDESDVGHHADIGETYISRDSIEMSGDMNDSILDSISEDMEDISEYEYEEDDRRMSDEVPMRSSGTDDGSRIPKTPDGASRSLPIR
ncbi:nuclear elongation and deformation protein 1 [Arthroderma uncinatum]|uniref:nuclear elongation and deformation protein 1 n=1 Tax=Arthroderma uncinatum TaxID=74035 RepID=UPI00144AE3B2|nr:nuclear elongation and deformation protein 1 [Arthroderma uncinatum]KAF3491266.1 nuclear elongation and deformation protein 1 [Arthroderma uncinatum]